MIDQVPQHSVFVSYAREDRDWVSVATNLLTAGGAKVFMDVRDIAYGDRWEDVLTKTLHKVERVLVFWSRHAAASEWVAKEWQLALNNGKRLVPVPIDDTPLPDDLSQFHALMDLKGLLQQSETTAPSAPAKSSSVMPYVALAGIAGLTVLFAMFFFISSSDPVSPGPPWLLIGAAVLALSAVNWFVRRRIKRKRHDRELRDSLSKYVSPDAVEEIMKGSPADTVIGKHVVDMVFEDRDHDNAI